MSVMNFVQCGLVTPIATNTTELVLNTPAAPYQLPPLDGGTLVIADSVARPSFYEIISYTHRIDNVIYGVVRAKEGTTARAWTGTTWVYQALTAADYIAALMLKADLNSAKLTGLPTAPTAALGTNTNQIATMAAIKQAIDALINGAPGALDALNEFANALGNDPNFATTMTNALAGKEPSIAAGTSAQMWLGNKTWASVLSQVQGTLLTGLGAGSNTTIVSTDSLIAALAKIQNQLNNKCASNDSRLTDSREWTAATVTQAVAEAGTDTVRTAWTAQRVAQAVRGNILTGLNLTLAGAVAATDTLLTAIGKLQKQITDAATNLPGNVRATVLTGYLSGSATALAATDTLLAALGKIQGQLDTKANLNSPPLTGSPTAPTAAVGTNTTQLATTAFVQAEIANDAPSKNGTGATGTWPIDVTGNASSATKLATARNINGKAFDGTANIEIEDRMGTAVASAATTTIGTAGLGETLHITGTTTITSFGVSTTGTRRTLIFLDALTLTFNSTSLIIPGAANFQTSGGTCLEVVCIDGANGYWRVVSFIRPTVSPTEYDYLDGVTSNLQTQLNAKAALASPALTGTPTAPTAAVGTNTTQLATTAFVQAEIANNAPSKTGAGASGSWGISVTGNAATATKLATSSTVALTGDVTGSATFDGSANVTITATVQDDSHNHVIGNVDGLLAALAAKQDLLTSGTNLKTINGVSLLSGGNIELATAAQVGDIASALDAINGTA